MIRCRYCKKIAILDQLNRCEHCSRCLRTTELIDAYERDVTETRIAVTGVNERGEIVTWHLMIGDRVMHRHTRDRGVIHRRGMGLFIPTVLVRWDHDGEITTCKPTDLIHVTNEPQQPIAELSAVDAAWWERKLSGVKVPAWYKS